MQSLDNVESQAVRRSAFEGYVHYNGSHPVPEVAVEMSNYLFWVLETLHRCLMAGGGPDRRIAPAVLGIEQAIQRLCNPEYEAVDIPVRREPLTAAELDWVAHRVIKVMERKTRAWGHVIFP